MTLCNELYMWAGQERPAVNSHLHLRTEKTTFDSNRLITSNAVQSLYLQLPAMYYCNSEVQTPEDYTQTQGNKASKNRTKYKCNLTVTKQTQVI